MNLKLSGRSLILPVLFAAFLLLRLFVSSPYCFIAMDEAKYLTLARNFPRHTLFNHQFYLVHPPLYPACIRFFSLILPDHIAGITVSFLSAVLTFFAAGAIFRLFRRDRYFTVLALAVLVISPLHIPTSRVIYKDAAFFAFFTLSLYLFLRGLLREESGSLYAAGLAGAAAFLTSDLAVALLPAGAAAYFIFRRPSLHFRPVFVSLLITLFPYGCWLLARVLVYKSSVYYPAGVDGTIEYVRDFTIRQLFTPRYFPATRMMFNFGLDLSEFRINANVYDLYPVIRLPVFLPFAFYAFTGLTALGGFVSALARRRFRDNPDLFFSLLLLLFSLPAALHPEPRFLIPILLPLGYLFSRGMTFLAARTGRGGKFIPRLAWGAVLIILGLTGILLLRSPCLIFSLSKEVEVPRTARFLAALPGDGIMAQVGYPPELSYLTGKRVLALPIVPRVLDRFIRRYDIHYLLYGQHYLAPVNPANASLVWCYRTIRYIQRHPEKYPLLGVIDENYRAERARPDRIFVYGVRRGAKEGYGQRD